MAMAPLLLKSTKKGETTCNLKVFLHIFSHKTTFTFIKMCTYSLAGCLFPFFHLDPSWEAMEIPPPPQERGEVSPPPPGTCSQPLHHCKSKRPPVKTQLTFQCIQNSNANQLPYLSCHSPTNGDWFPSTTIERMQQANILHIISKCN